MKNHLTHMAIAGVGVLAVLVVVGVDLGTAVPWALLLACPLMMVAMMWAMSRGQGGHAGGEPGGGRDSAGSARDAAPEDHHH